jgi:hypothetical protein
MEHLMHEGGEEVAEQGLIMRDPIEVVGVALLHDRITNLVGDGFGWHLLDANRR